MHCVTDNINRQEKITEVGILLNLRYWGTAKRFLYVYMFIPGLRINAKEDLTLTKL